MSHSGTQAANCTNNNNSFLQAMQINWLFTTLLRPTASSSFVMKSPGGIYYFIFSGSAAQRGLWPPVALQPSADYRLLVHVHDAPQSVELLWTSDQLVAETSTWQHTPDKDPCPRRDSNHYLSRRATVDLRLRPRGHWDRQSWRHTEHNFDKSYVDWLEWLN
jgi:hypothetical protein